MFELPDDAIGIYHRMFDFFGVRIPFSSFLLTLIKHYRVHFSQLGPLGLNKVITFEVLCRSLQIKPTVTLFRVFQTLCKQADWFSFAKRRAPSSVCIDDNRSCMKHWKSGFFFIDCRAIPDAMVWIHPNADIDDLRPTTGSFNMADVRHLSAHVIKLRDMPEDVLVLSRLSRVWKSRVSDPVLRGADGNGMGVVMGIHDFLCLPEWTGAEVQEEPHLDVRPTLQWLSFYCIPSAAAEAVIPYPTPEDLAVGTPSFKIVAKVEASQKPKASTSSAALSYVVKRTSSALAQLSGSTTRPSLFVGDDDESDDDDDDACVEISLVTPLHSAVVIPSSGNQGGSFASPTAEGSNTRDSRGKGIMVDDAVAPSSGVSRPRPSFRPAPSFKDVSGDAIHTDFFPFSVGLYYAIYPEGGVARNCEFTREEWDAPYLSTFGVLTKDVFKDPAICKIVVDQFPTPDEMVRVESLSDDHCRDKCASLYDDVAWWLKGYEEKVANMTGLKLYVAALKKQVSKINDKLTSFDASFAKFKAKGKERKKKIKSLGKSLDNLHAEGLVRKFLASDEFSRVQRELFSLAASVGFERGLSMHRTKDEFAAVLKKMVNFMPVILQLEPEKLVRPANVPIPRGTRVSPSIAKESTMKPVSESLELSANVNFTISAVAFEHNEEMVNAEVDGSNPKMTDDTAAVKSMHAFVQGISVVLDDVIELVEVGSGRVPSGPNDVVVSLSAHEKGDGLDSFYVAGEEATVNSPGV
ncbi:hypothetical protein Tco_0424204 [Tanacetum coccineum]